MQTTGGVLCFWETVCDFLNVNLGELTRVPKTRHPAGFFDFTGGVFAFGDTNDNFSV